MGTIWLDDDFQKRIVGQIVSLDSSWTNDGYTEVLNPPNLSIVARSSMPAALLADPNFPSAKTKLLRGLQSAAESEAHLVWEFADRPGHTQGLRSAYVSWQEFRPTANRAGEKLCRMGSRISYPLGNRLLDIVIYFAQNGAMGVIANSANMFDFGDQPICASNAWTGKLSHWEIGVKLSTGINADGSVSVWQEGALLGTASGLRMFLNTTDAATNLELFEIGGWNSGSGTFQTWPIDRNFAQWRVADYRLGVWPITSPSILAMTNIAYVSALQAPIALINPTGSLALVGTQLGAVGQASIQPGQGVLAVASTPSVFAFKMSTQPGALASPGTTAGCISGSVTPRAPAGAAMGMSGSAPTVTSASRPSVLKSNFGFYGVFDYSGSVNANRFANGDSGIINALAANPSIGNPPDNLMGVAFIMQWTALDNGTSSPNYDFSVVDLYANAIKAKKKQWWLWINWSGFVTNSSNASVTTGFSCVPQWLINQNGVFTCLGNYRRSDLNPPSAPGAGVFAKLYNTPVLNAYIALLQQIATRYDSDPYFEGVVHGIGTANPSFNGVDTLGTKYPQINYNTDYSDTGMVAAFKSIMSRGRAAFATSNIWLTTDYLFNEAGSSSYTGQDVDWTGVFQAAIASKCMLGGVDSWTQNWIYPQIPFTSTGQNAYAANTNPNSRRGVYSDQIYRGWRGPTPGVGTGFRGQIRYAACEELTEMGGYIGQFSAADVMSYRGPALDNVHYMFFDINYLQSGNYGTNPGVTPGAPKAPNTLWLAAASYDATYGQSVYRFIQGAGPTNQVDPYA